MIRSSRSTPPRRTGVLHTEHHALGPGHPHRRVRVYVPAAYDGARAFPLLVLFDGQNVFDDEGSFAGGWRAHRAVDRLAKKRTRPIVVAIDHSGAGRIDELSPWSRMGAPGGADPFIVDIATKLLPDLRRRYHVVEGPAGVLVGGSSMGGLAATYAHYRFPEAFGGAIAMSPSYWLTRGKIFELVTSRSRPWTSQVYLDAGQRERGAVLLVQRMADALRGHGYGSDKLLVKIDARGDHSERSWRRRLPAALRFFYR